jgi:hypothetical protein
VSRYVRLEPDRPDYTYLASAGEDEPDDAQSTRHGDVEAYLEVLAGLSRRLAVANGRG